MTIRCWRCPDSRSERAAVEKILDEELAWLGRRSEIEVNAYGRGDSAAVRARKATAAVG